MRLNIPEIGTKLVLSSAWTFTIHDEGRNERFFKLMLGEPKRKKVWHSGLYSSNTKYSDHETPECNEFYFDEAEPVKMALPKGTILIVDRYYIRQGNKDYSSLTFKIEKDKKLGNPSGRFWVKLEDVNNIECEGEYQDKWPNGRFFLNISEGECYECNNCKKPKGWGIPCSGHCSCSSPSFLKYSHQVLNWHSVGGDAHNNGRIASIIHERMGNGTDRICKPARWTYQNPSDGAYNKSFATLDELIEWATRKGFTKPHIEAFLKVYKEKKAQAEKDVVEGR